MPTPLPESAQQIADLIGRENTLKLASVAKWRKLYVPHTMAGDHLIVRTIGADAAKTLHFNCRGEYLDLAKCCSIFVEQRNALIRKAYLKGADVRTLMRDNKLSLRALRYILAGKDGRARKSLSVKRGKAAQSIDQHA